MANYNSGRLYNRILTDGGANYNSGPFTIIILDNGYGLDTIESIFTNIESEDIGTSDDAITLIANVEIIDHFTSDDTISVQANIATTDIGTGFDFTSITANVNVSDSGSGIDFISTVGAFFVIDSNNYLQPLGLLVTRDSRYELLPSTRDNVEELPGRHGEFDFGTEFKAKMMELHVATDEGYSPLEKAHLQRLFAMYLDPTKGAKTLIFSDDVEKTYMVKYSGKIDLTQYASWFEFVLPFKMTDPFIVGSFEKTLVGNGTLVNEGTFETEMIIEINGPATNPSLTIGSEILSYTGTIPNAQTLVINTGLGTAKLNGNNALAGYNGVFPLLPPGNTSVTASSNIVIRWKDKWI